MTRQELIQMMNSNGIDYEIREHIPVYTVEEMLETGLAYPKIIVKTYLSDMIKKERL